MRLLGRWLADGFGLAMALALALLAMQAPALTHDYTSALLQVTQEAGRDITQRQDAARRYYDLAGVPADQVMAALAAREPSNAATLALAMTRMQVLRAAYDRIEAAPALLQPLTLLLDTLTDGGGAKADIMRTTLQTYSPAIVLTTAAAIYGLAGLFAGSLLAGMLVAAAAAVLTRSRRRPAY